MISPALRASLEAWLVDATSAVPSDVVRDYGVCHWSGRHMELSDLFKAQGLHPSYPFGERSYDARHKHGSMHKCPVRLAWVRKTLGVS